MTTQTEALKLALEALEELNNTNSYWWQEVDEQTINKIEPAITAIKEALAQPEQEPVACVAEVSTYDGYLRKEVVWNKRIDSFSLGTRFYTTPPQRKPDHTEDNLAMVAQPGQEPVAWGMPSAGEGHIVDVITPEEHDRVEGGYTVPLYTTPPQPKEPEQEPVAWMYPDALCDKACLYLCTKGFTQFPECANTPPQRTWVGLTEDERTAIREGVATFHDTTGWDYAKVVQQATELKLQEKNA